MSSDTDQRSYYERVTKPKRAAERAEKMRQRGVSRLTGGPPRKGQYVQEFHIKLSPELAQFVEEQSQEIGTWAYFRSLVQNDFLTKQQSS